MKILTESIGKIGSIATEIASFRKGILTDFTQNFCYRVTRSRVKLTSTDRPLANNKNKDEKKIHPCLRCGACCAHFRVSFYWREAEADDHATAVPRELTEDINDRYRAMKGTERRHRPVCVALQGRIGVDAHCSIYKWRPSPCRNFAPSFERGENGENGVKNPRCDEARAAHGLPPLSREDWSGLNTDR